MTNHFSYDRDFAVPSGFYWFEITYCKKGRKEVMYWDNENKVLLKSCDESLGLKRPTNNTELITNQQGEPFKVELPWIFKQYC